MPNAWLINKPYWSLNGKYSTSDFTALIFLRDNLNLNDQFLVMSNRIELTSYWG